MGKGLGMIKYGRYDSDNELVNGLVNNTYKTLKKIRFHTDQDSMMAGFFAEFYCSQQNDQKNFLLLGFLICCREFFIVFDRTNF